MRAFLVDLRFHWGMRRINSFSVAMLRRCGAPENLVQGYQDHLIAPYKRYRYARRAYGMSWDKALRYAVARGWGSV